MGHFSGERKTDTSAKLASIVVRDTIISAYAQKEVGGADYVRTILTALQGPDGGTLTQSVLSQYTLSSFAEEVSGVQASLDLRVARQPFINVAAENLQQAMINQLELFLDLPKLDQAKYLTRLKKQKSRESKKL